MKKVEEILNIAGSMQQFSSSDDKLTELVDDIFNEELSLEDLELVSAAANTSMKSFSDFEKLLESRH